MTPHDRPGSRPAHRMGPRPTEPDRPSTGRLPGPQGGPPLLAPALAYGALMIAGVILSARTPQPSAAATDVLSYVRAHHTELQVAGFLSFGAAAPLAIWSATVYRRLRTLGITAPGAVIALAGGLLSAASLALSGLIGWTSAQSASVAGLRWPRPWPTWASRPWPGRVRGAAGAAAGRGQRARADPAADAAAVGLVRPGGGGGLVPSTVTLLTSALDPTLPVGRFGSLVFLVAVSLLLPWSRHALRGSVA